MRPAHFLCLALIALHLSAYAREVRLWTEAELLQASDLVVVGQPVQVKNLNEIDGLGWQISSSFHGYHGVETTFKVLDVLKGMPANDHVILHHYWEEFPGQMIDGPDLINFTLGSTNQWVLYLVKEGTNRYAPVTGQIDAHGSIKQLTSDRWQRGGFPELPIANADPAITHPVKIRVPVRLHAKWEKDHIKIETDECTVTNLLVGINMITGTTSVVEGFQDGHRVIGGGMSLHSGLANGPFEEDQLHTNSVSAINPDHNLTLSIRLTLFETDIPVQHAWSPQSGKYRVLYDLNYQTVVAK